MEMFNGKKGPRVFKRREDAEFVAERRNLEAKKIRVIDEKMAQKEGVSIHPDLSIAARDPQKGETGWIVIGKDNEIKERYEKALEIVKTKETSK